MKARGVSIIIPAYNAESYLSHAIDSALNQTCSVKEIIVVDDGSSDRTLDIALRYRDNSAIIVISQPNKGASAARNTGLAASTGDYIQFLDADDTLDKGKIQHQLIMIQRYGDDFIYSGRWGLFYNNESTAEFQRNELWKNYESPIDWIVTAWTTRKWIHPSAWLTPRHLILKAGLWDESLSLHDDGEFFCRVILRSNGVIFCEDAKSYYRKGISSSLSSIISSKAIDSHYKICKLYEEYLIAEENSTRTRLACATNYLSFHYDYFPHYSALRKKVIGESERLGGSDIKPDGTDIFFLAKRFVGWKLAKRFERLYFRSTSKIKSIFKRL